MRHLTFICICMLALYGCTGEWSSYPIQKNVEMNDGQIIQAGDSLSVEIFDEPQLSGDYTVSQNGKIQLPLAGDIAVEGNNLNQTRQLIAETYIQKGYLVNPKVSLSVSQDQTVLILGEVITSGEYPYKGGMTILDLIAKSGGFSYRANQNEFDIIRKSSDGEDKIIKAAISTRIRSGDVIRVRERFF